MGTLLYTLCTDEVFTTTTLEANGWDEHVLTNGEFEVLGPAIVDIVAHAQGSNFSPAFKYEIVLQPRGPYGPWTTPTTNQLVAGTTSETYQIGPPFSDRAKLGLQVRVVLRTAVQTGTSTTQQGNLTIALAVRLYQGC